MCVGRSQRSSQQPASDPLRKSAEEILAGVKRPTAVEDVMARRGAAVVNNNPHVVHYLVNSKEGRNVIFVCI